MNTARGTWSIWLVTSGCLGYLRPAPGTWGSLPPVVLGAALVLIGRASAGDMDFNRMPAWVWAVWHGLMIALTLLFSAVCVRAGDEAEALFGKKDPGHVTADETAGMALTLALCPAPFVIFGPPASIGPAVLLLAGAFVAFRLTDIVKAWPAGRLQAVRGGWGILLDDLAAGVQAAVLVWLAWVVVR